MKSKDYIELPLMVHLFIYGVRDAIATNRSCPDGRFGFPRPALPEFRFSFSAFIADLSSFFHGCGFPTFALPFC